MLNLSSNFFFFFWISSIIQLQRLKLPPILIIFNQNVHASLTFSGFLKTKQCNQTRNCLEREIGYLHGEEERVAREEIRFWKRERGESDEELWLCVIIKEERENNNDNDNDNNNDDWIGEEEEEEWWRLSILEEKMGVHDNDNHMLMMLLPLEIEQIQSSLSLSLSLNSKFSHLATFYYYFLANLPPMPTQIHSACVMYSLLSEI